ncbi:MAG: hypothetical protein IPH34_14120 [Chitinophagaceae bacterium]|nr:hypothetical protein [Chitinophagaceae bacterium]
MKPVATIFLFIFSMAFICPSLSSIIKSEKTICFTIDEEKTNTQNYGCEEVKKETKNITRHLFSAIQLLNDSKSFNSPENAINSSPYLGILTPPPDFL